MNSKKIIYVLFIVFTLYSMMYQLKANGKIAGKTREQLEAIENNDADHPLLIVNESLLRPYVDALGQMRGAPEEKFWLVGWDQDPSIMLNYHVYPGKLYMSVATQRLLHLKNLKRDPAPIEHTPPTSYEKVIIIEEYTARLAEEWAGNL